jgi:hypothetical protein
MWEMEDPPGKTTDTLGNSTSKRFEYLVAKLPAGRREL